MNIPRQSAAARILTAFVLIAAAACGSHGGSAGVSTSSELQDTGYLRLRWFPLERADSYFLEVTNAEGGTVVQEEVQPIGCTHETLEGYTSGVCAYDFKKPLDSDSIAIQLGARTDQGISNPSLLRYHPGE